MDCSSQNQIKHERFVLQVPSMLPDEVHPYWGIFMQAHMKSVLAVQIPIVSYYGYSLPSKDFQKTKPNSFEEIHSHMGDYPEIRQRNRHRLGWQIIGFYKFYRWVKKHKKQIHIIHAHGVAWGGIWSILAGRRLNIPVIVTEHSSGFPLNLHPPLLKRLFRMVLPKADALLPVTKNLGGFLEKYAPDVPQYYVPNCVDTDLFSPSPIPVPQTPLKILFVGSFVDVKHVDLLLKACSELNKESPIHLTLVGAGPLKEKLQNLAEKLGLKNNIYFAGHLPSEKVQAEMKKAHLLALSSKWESQPCVLIEAMLSGRPVVAPDVGGVSEMISDDSGQIFEPENLENLVRAMKIVRDRLPEYNSDLISEKCSQKHSFDSVGHQLEEIYTKYAGEFVLENGPVDELLSSGELNKKVVA